MTHEERNNLMAIVVGIMIIIYIAWNVHSKVEAGVFTGPDGLMLWARTVLWAIPIGVISMIVGTILMAIIYAIATGDPKPSFIVDERDKLIGNWGMKVTIGCVSTGFIMAIIGLAMGSSAFVVLNVIFFSFAAGDLFGNLTKLVLWRRGL